MAESAYRPVYLAGVNMTKKKIEADPYVDEYLDWTFEHQISWAIGIICLGIGKGDVRHAVWQVIDRERRSCYRREELQEK